MKRLLLLIIALLASPVMAQTYTNMPISCPRADGKQADAAACTDTEQFQRPVSANDVVLACAKATACGWYDAELKWQKWSTVPATATVVVCPLAAIVGPMACPGPTNPVWGGLTFVPKAQVLVAAISPTPGTLTRIISWTNPTTNTDGTPVCTITGTRVQASLQPDFAGWLQWETAGAVTNIRIINAPEAVPLYWRAATLCGTVPSAWSTPAVRTEAQWAEFIAPSCEPTPPGVPSSTATEAFYDVGMTGSAMYFACKQPDGTWKDAGTYGLNNYTCIGRYAAANFILDTAIRQATKATIWADCLRKQDGDEAYRPKWEALRAAHRPADQAAPRFVTAKNSTLPSRPAKAIVNGARTSTDVGRVGIGVPCDCVAYKEGTTTLWCAVTGQPNVATAAVDYLESSAALCVSVP